MVDVSTSEGGAPSVTVFICGSGHSGTTLLDMMLGGHPDVSALGEIGALPFNLDGAGEADRCACKKAVLQCPFWLAIDSQLRGPPYGLKSGLRDLVLADPAVSVRRFHNGQFHSRLPGERRLPIGLGRPLALLINRRSILDIGAVFNRCCALWRTIYVHRNILYEAVRAAHRTSFVVDSTKNPGYLKGVWWYRRSQMKFIEVVRDGRALCWARTQREGWTMKEAASIWVREYIKRVIALRGIPSKDILRVRYEDLAQSPRQELERISGFLGISGFIENMLHFREQRHNVGGNPNRYNTSEDQIQLDERWKAKLSNADSNCFERKAGWLNRRLGYK